MWANNHRAVKLSRNDYPGIIRMVKEQAENYLYQPVPLPKSRVIIRMMDGTWAMHRAIARVSLSPDEELVKYRGYFLVRNLLTGKEKILPLESGFAWEAIHSIMDTEKLNSIHPIRITKCDVKRVSTLKLAQTSLSMTLLLRKRN